jgi:uncharacterized membrane protein YozB (DUF420 family)
LKADALVRSLGGSGVNPLFDLTDVRTWALYVEIAIALMLLAGMVLVRRGHVRAHMFIQSSMVLVNIPIVLIAMGGSFFEYVWPGLPGDIGQSFYFFPTMMLVAGIAAEALGVYIILVAGTTVVPERFRFRRYKLWMRTELILWWATLLAGVATYYVWWIATA